MSPWYTPFRCWGRGLAWPVLGSWHWGVNEVGALSRVGAKVPAEASGAALPPARPGWGSQGCRAVARG